MPSGANDWRASSRALSNVPLDGYPRSYQCMTSTWIGPDGFAGAPAAQIRGRIINMERVTCIYEPAIEPQLNAKLESPAIVPVVKRRPGRPGDLPHVPGGLPHVSGWCTLEPMNLGTMLRESAARTPRKPAVICGERVVSFEAFDRSSDALARW